MNPWEQWSFSSTAMSTWKQWLSSASEGANIAPNPQDEALKKHLAQAISGVEEPEVVPVKDKGLGLPMPKFPMFDEHIDPVQDTALQTIETIMQAQIKSVMSAAEYKAQLKAKYLGEPEPPTHDLQDNTKLAHSLIQQVPGLQSMVTMPCNHGPQKATVQTCIMHLNDLHMPKQPWQVKDSMENSKSPFWSRERIADWLDTLDVDLKVTAPGQEPWRLAIEKVWADAEMEAMLGGQVTATLFNQSTKRSTRAQSLTALLDMVKAAKRRGHKFIIRIRVHPQMWQMDADGNVTHTPNWFDEKALEQVTAATKALVEALKPLADQAKAAAEILTKAIGDNTQLLAVMGEVSKKKEDKEA